MSSDFFTRLECNNPKVIKEVAKGIGYEDKVDEVWWFHTNFSVHTRGGFPHDEVKKISRQFPNEVITCRYSCSPDDYSEVHTVEYKAGQDNVVSFENQYSFSVIPLCNGLDNDRIFDKVRGFFRSICYYRII